MREFPGVATSRSPDRQLRWRPRRVLAFSAAAWIGLAVATTAQVTVSSTIGALFAWTDRVGEFTRHDGEVYARRDGRELKLDLYLPATKGPHPFVLVIHGGSWTIGTRTASEAPTIARALAKRGIAAVSLDYRKAPKHPFPAQIEDCRRALQWLRANAARFDLDPRRAAALGASAGGHLAALLATEDDQARPDSPDPIERQSTRVACCAAFITPFDLVPSDDEPMTATQYRIVSRFLGVTEGSSKDEILARAVAASPRSHVDAQDPPFLIVAGETDRLVPLRQGRVMLSTLRAAKVKSELIVIPGGGHGSWMGDIERASTTTIEAYWPRTVLFLRRHLDLPLVPDLPAPARNGSGPTTPR